MVLDSLHEGVVNNQDISEFQRLFVLIFFYSYLLQVKGNCMCMLLHKENQSDN